MRALKLIIMLAVLIGSPSYSQVYLTNAEISRLVPHNGASFSQEFELPLSSHIEIRIPNISSLTTNNIQVLTPEGVVIDQSNAETNNASYYSHNPTNEYEKVYGLVDSWVITLDQAAAGKYIVSGDVNGDSDVPIHITIVDSVTKYSLILGERNSGISTNRPIPISVFLAQENGKYSAGIVEFEIIKDGVVKATSTVKDDGLNGDPVNSDGLYTMFYSADEVGLYTLKAEIKNIDQTNPLFSTNLLTNFEVNAPTIVIDRNYTEEVIDTDSDGYMDELVLSFPILESNVTSGYLSTYGKLVTSNGEFLDDYRRIEIGENRVYVKFSGDELRSLNYSGSYSFESFHLKHVDSLVTAYENLRNTAVYSNDMWERENLIYANSFSDEALDLNNNGFYDQIRITFEVDSILSGNFGLSTHAITQLDNETGVFGVPSVNLTQGTNTVELIVSSEEFVSLGEKTSLAFKDLFVYPLFNADALLEIENVGTTKVYDCWHFAGCKDGPNTQPVAVDDSAYTDGRTISINAAANDIDDDGDLIKVNAITQPVNGTATIVGNAVQYTPAESFEGQESFEYEILDVHPDNNVWKRGKDTGVITVTVTRNAPPVANDDSYDVAVDGEAQLAVLENDTDADEDRLYINEVTSPDNGTVTNYGHIIVYKPNAGFAGTDTFEYTIVDVDVDTNVAKGGSDTARVTLNVGTIVNTPPTAEDDVFSVEIGVDTTLDVVANDYDLDGDSVYIIEYSLPTKGTIDVINNKFIYTPNADATGQDSFVYKISDTKGGEAIAGVTINILQQNSAPVANDDSITTDKNVSVSVDVLSNDQDPDNDTISIVSFTQPPNGLVTKIGEILTYEPSVDFVGNDSFTYTIDDGKGMESTASVFVTVLDEPTQNNEPVANNDIGTTAKGQSIVIDVLQNDSDPDGDALIIEGYTQGSNGQVSIVSEGLEYTPEANFIGSDSFSYTIIDNKGGRATASVTISVVEENSAPTANNDEVETATNTAVSIDVLGNDFDSDGDILVIASTTEPANGAAEIVGSNIVYTPNHSFIGSDSFDYTIADGKGGTSSATVNISIVDQNVEPIAVDDSIEIYESDTIIIDVLANDSDPNGDVLTVVGVESVGFGSTSIVDNKVQFTAYEGFVGDYSVAYTITDGEYEATAAVLITINREVSNSPSIAINTPVNGEEFVVGENIAFKAIASDPEDGDISSEIRWTSQIEGEIGVGSDITVQLSEGSHMISATVADTDENTVFDTIEVVVRGIADHRFINNQVHNIPDNKGYGVVSSVSVPLELNVQTLMIHTNIEHNQDKDIAVQLLSPAGKRYNLSNPGQYTSGKIWVINVDDIRTEGTWSLKVSDQKKDVTGTLQSWSISFE